MGRRGGGTTGRKGMMSPRLSLAGLILMWSSILSLDWPNPTQSLVSVRRSRLIWPVNSNSVDKQLKSCRLLGNCNVH